MGKPGNEILVRDPGPARLMGAVKADVPTGTTSLEERFRAGEAGALDELVRSYQEILRRHTSEFEAIGNQGRLV